jgi:excisionase family DNA binding protein
VDDGEPSSEQQPPTTTCVVGVASVAENALPLALTVQDAARVLRLDPRTIRGMVRSGELDGNQKGHAIRISRSSVLDWLRGKRRAPRSKR